MNVTANRLSFLLLHCVLALAFLLVANVARAQAISNSPTIQIGGRINFISTGGSLRTQADTGNSCLVNATSSQALSGIPVGATVRAAYLYWGGSGTTADTSISLNGNTVNASRTFASAYNNGGTLLSFFGGFANVTSLISGNATMTFGNLTVNTGGDYCDSSAVLSGWGLVVIYEQITQPYRVINIFDGLQNFRGSSLTLTPTGFRIPTGGDDGKISVITWEGDPGNSTVLNGFSESLTFNGSPLDDGINVANSNPTVQQFDGTINTLNVATSYGVDVDTYDVTNLVSAGQTSATTVYSAGGDLVLLTSQIVSVTSEPLIDLSITKTHSGNFTVGTNGSYTLQIANAAGLEPVNYPITVTDTLPTGLTYVSATGTGWVCAAIGQAVTCVNPGPLASGASLPAITLNVAVGNAAFPSVTNTATVSAPSTVETNAANNTASDPTTVLGPNVTATKTVSDLNAGDANPGDTLRYTITLNETAGIAGTGISVTDHIPGNTSNFSVTTLPGGAINSSTGNGTGNNGVGFLNITNISIPANGTVTIIFTVQVAAGTSPGATIANTAAVNNPAGPDPTPSSQTLIVSQSQIPGAGTKQLYLWSNGGNVLSRTRPTGTHVADTILGAGLSDTWTITPTLALPVALQAGSFPVRLLIAHAGSSTGSSRNVTVRLANSVLGTLGTAALNQDFDGATLTTFNLTLATSVIAPAGSTFSLQITNNTTIATRSITVTPYSGANYSRVDLNSATVIEVESVDTYNATYAGGTLTSSFMRGLGTVYVRAVVSDPFGSFDISSATVSLVDPANSTAVNAQPMIQVASDASTKTYQYAYAVPANAVAGAWTIRVTANEGVEGVNDLGVGQFTVTIPMPTILISKISQVISDPVNGTTNPKSIPNSIQRYTLTVTNTGPGAVDSSTLAITDALPTNVSMYVATSGGDPVFFQNSLSAPSGLTYSYATNVTYSTQPGGGAPYTYIPAPDANGFDAAITGVRVIPGGVMSAASGGNQPSFTLQFRVRIK